MLEPVESRSQQSGIAAIMVRSRSIPKISDGEHEEAFRKVCFHESHAALTTDNAHRRHVDAISKNPGIDVEKVRNSRYLPEFDRHLQCPSWGYPTEGAYYRDASSVETIMAVRVPTFIIHAEDDPIAPKEVLPFEEIKLNPYAVMCSTDMGGHLSWFEWGGGRWFVKPVSTALAILVIAANSCSGCQLLAGHGMRRGLRRHDSQW